MSDDLEKRLRAIDHLSVEDCFCQSALYDQAAVRIEALTADNARLRAALECLLIEYDYAELAQAEPPSLTAAVFSARDALNTGKNQP